MKVLRLGPLRRAIDTEGFGDGGAGKSAGGKGSANQRQAGSHGNLLGICIA
jgi:hypothetical protein